MHRFILAIASALALVPAIALASFPNDPGGVPVSPRVDVNGATTQGSTVSFTVHEPVPGSYALTLACYGGYSISTFTWWAPSPFYWRFLTADVLTNAGSGGVDLTHYYGTTGGALLDSGSWGKYQAVQCVASAPNASTSFVIVKPR